MRITLVVFKSQLNGDLKGEVQLPFSSVSEDFYSQQDSPKGSGDGEVAVWEEGKFHAYSVG